MSIAELCAALNEPMINTSDWSNGEIREYRAWLEEAYYQENRYISEEEAWEMA